MENVVIPEFYCPISPAINENVEMAHEHTIQWTCDFKLIPHNGEKYEHFCVAKFAWLAARAYPDVSIDDLNLISDWTSWLFCLDDTWDDDPDMGRFLFFEKELLDILNVKSITAHDEPFTLGLYDIKQRLLQKTTPVRVNKFCSSVKQYFQGAKWEHINRLQNKLCLATYLKMRLFASAMYTYFDLIGLHQNSRIPEFREQIYVQQLEVMVNNWVSWVNDIFGLHREIKEGNLSNLVRVLQEEYSLSQQEAVNGAVEMCDAEMRAFLILESQIPLLEKDENLDLKRHIKGLRSWMRGYLDWHTIEDTKRYQVE